MTANLLKTLIGRPEMPLIARRDRRPTTIAARALSLSTTGGGSPRPSPRVSAGGEWEESGRRRIRGTRQRLL